MLKTERQTIQKKIEAINLSMCIIFGWLVIRTDKLQCSNSITRGPGPYEILSEEVQYAAPSKLILNLARIYIVEDVKLAIIYRAYWKSYCYNGGPLDPVVQ